MSENPFDLDNEVLEYIRRSAQYSPDLPPGQKPTIEVSRACYGKICEAFHQPYPQGVTGTDGQVETVMHSIPVRTYHWQNQPSKVAIAYYHGGGYVLGNLETHDSICAELCANTGLSVVAVDYRLAPEHIHPAQIEDSVAAFQFIAKEYDEVIVAGDSAGGNLSAGICLQTRGSEHRPLGQLLIYPTLGGELLDLDSYREMGHAPLLSADDMNEYLNQRSGGEPPRDDPIFSPIIASDFSDLPVCYAFSADVDPLRDDARVYVDKLTDAGVEAHYVNATGLVHGHLRARHSSEKARAQFDAICDAARRIAAMAETG